MIIIMKLFWVYSSIISGFIRDSQSFAAGMPTSDESNRGLNAPDLPTNPSLKNAPATPAKRKNLATCDGTSPGKPRGITESPASGILRSPGGWAQIVEEISGNMGKCGERLYLNMHLRISAAKGEKKIVRQTDRLYLPGGTSSPPPITASIAFWS